MSFVRHGASSRLCWRRLTRARSRPFLMPLAPADRYVEWLWILVHSLFIVVARCLDSYCCLRVVGGFFARNCHERTVDITLVPSSALLPRAHNELQAHSFNLPTAFVTLLILVSSFVHPSPHLVTGRGRRVYRADGLLLSTIPLGSFQVDMLPYLSSCV